MEEDAQHISDFEPNGKSHSKSETKEVRRFITQTYKYNKLHFCKDKFIHFSNKQRKKVSNHKGFSSRI
jgi:hypothetical protein